MTKIQEEVSATGLFQVRIRIHVGDAQLDRSFDGSLKKPLRGDGRLPFLKRIPSGHQNQQKAGAIRFDKRIDSNMRSNA
jgi:hypothetical protein